MTELAEVRTRARTLSHVGSAGPVLGALTGKEEAARLLGSRVSPMVFDMLEARPMLGRAFGVEEEASGAEPVIVLSYGAWQQFFQGTPDIVGHVVAMDSVLGPRTQYRYTVVGVMPGDFAYPDRQTQFWLPFQAVTSTGSAPLRGPLVARLADGGSIDAATAEIESLLRRIRPEAPATRYELVREQSELVAPVKAALLVLTGAVGFVLLIACVNAANLLLARTAAREREIAVRVAIALGIYSAVGVVLALIGIYGVIAYSVTQRTREIGDVLGLVLRQGLALTAIGIGCGLAGAAALSRYLEGLLYGLTPLDAGTYFAVSLMFALVAAVASYVRRVGRQGSTPLWRSGASRRRSVLSDAGRPVARIRSFSWANCDTVRWPRG